MNLPDIERTALSDIDIYNKLRGKTNVLLYRELKNINQIEQILKDNSVVILYEKKPKRKHWICIIRYLKNNIPTLEFFDSYGFFPDDEKKLINKKFLRSTNQRYNKIAELLLEASNRYY